MEQREQREAGLMTTTGFQGVGKTYQNMHLIKNYVSDKLKYKVRGRKCLIFDTNGEYTEEQFADNGIPNFSPKKIKISDIKAWSRNPSIVECRRVDAKSLSIAQKKEAIEYIVKVFRNGLLVLEDINSYILLMTHMENIVSGLINLRHKACDVLISYQSLRAVEPRIWQNSKWVRMHFQMDNVDDIKGKVTNPPLFKICQILVNNKRDAGDERFFVYINCGKNKAEGKFSRGDFKEAVSDYLHHEKRMLKEYQNMKKCNPETAMNDLTIKLTNQFFGNVKK